MSRERENRVVERGQVDILNRMAHRLHQMGTFE